MKSGSLNRREDSPIASWMYLADGVNTEDAQLAHSFDMYIKFYSLQLMNSRTDTEARPVISCLGNYAGYSSYFDAVSLRASGPIP